MKFEGTIRKFEKGLWSYHIIVPQNIYEALTGDGKKRVLCRINDEKAFHAGFMPDGKGNYFVKLNKQKMIDFGLAEGMKVEVNLEKDRSKYGMDISKEMKEVLSQDIEGAAYFEKLTDGKKRTLIYMVNTVKSTGRRIGKSLAILEHLKTNQGRLDYKLLNEAFRSSF